jgi:hypothetical protein
MNVEENLCNIEQKDLDSQVVIYQEIYNNLEEVLNQ